MLRSQENGGKVWAGIATDLAAITAPAAVTGWCPCGHFGALWSIPGKSRDVLTPHWDHPKHPLCSAVLPLVSQSWNGLGWEGLES